METIVVFKLNREAGFYSIFFFLCWAYIHAKSMHYKFYIMHAGWPYTYKLGWHDYFDSLEIYTPSEHIGKNIIHYSHNNMLGISGYPLSMYIDCIKEIYKLKPFILKQSIALQKYPYAALFVRRGDKLISEAQYISTELILASTDLMNHETIFVQTDDYRVVEEVRQCYPTKNIMSTVPTTKFGSYADDRHVRLDKQNDKIATVVPLHKKSLEIIYEETQEMLVGLDICMHATICWADITSNVSRFIKLASMDNVHSYLTDISVDLSKKLCPAFSF